MATTTAKLEVNIKDATNDILDMLSSLKFEVTGCSRSIKDFERVITEQLRIHSND